MFRHNFCDSEHCAQRLLKQWKKHPDLIIAVDFDDTVKPFGEAFDCSEVIDLLKKCNEYGFRLVVYTAAKDSRFEEIKQFYADHQIEISGINRNLLAELGTIGNSGKIYYNLLLDDRAGLGSALETLTILLSLIDVEKESAGNLTLEKPEDIPVEWERFTVKKKTRVRVRLPKEGREAFQSTGGEIFAVQGEDVVLVDDVGKAWPIKTEIFKKTYVVDEVSDTGFFFRKAGTNVIFKIPADVKVNVKTLEGDLKGVTAPNFVVIGAENELYTNTQEYVEDNLEIVRN